MWLDSILEFRYDEGVTLVLSNTTLGSEWEFCGREIDNAGTLISKCESKTSRMELRKLMVEAINGWFVEGMMSTSELSGATTRSLLILPGFESDRVVVLKSNSSKTSIKFSGISKEDEFPLPRPKKSGARLPKPLFDTQVSPLSAPESRKSVETSKLFIRKLLLMSSSIARLANSSLEVV